MLSPRGFTTLLFLLPTLLLANGEKYRGFTIDESRVAKRPNLEEIRTATKEQIDIVCAVGLSAEMLEFFQSVPFVLVPAESVRAPTPGLYSPGEKRVVVTSRIPNIGRRPVLLHELLHAWHHQRVPQGPKNATLLKFFAEAKSLGAYKETSHMMRNVGEFFACAGTTYLFGVTAQEPFKRETIAERQPGLFAHLKTMFGADAGRYAGSLTR